MMIKGIEYLRRKLNDKRDRVLLRYDYYDMKEKVRDLHISTPDQLRWLQSSLEWCATAVDSLADRLTFNGFKYDNFRLNEIFEMNNPDILTDSAIKGALIGSCSFIYISVDNDGFPRFQVIDGSDATGVIDPITYLLTEGYAVLERDPDTGKPELEAYFLPNETIYFEAEKPVRRFAHAVESPLLVPIIFRPDADRPFGHSRISRACMDYYSAAVRTLKRAEISAEFYSFPQKYVSGISEDAKIDRWKAAISSLLTITNDENGNKPTIGQFTQQSMTPHIEQLRMYAALFAGATGLTLDDLGFASVNPSSAEAIKSSHENLRRTALKAQKTFGSGFLNAGMLAASLRDNMQYKRKAFYQTKPSWAPAFEPDAAALTMIGDGAIKINQAVEGYFDKESLAELTGIRPAGE